MNKNHKAGSSNNERPLVIVTAKRMNNYYVRKYRLSDEIKVLVTDCEIRHGNLVPNEGTDVELYDYLADVSGKKREKLMKGTQVLLDNDVAYYFNPNKWLLILLPMLLAAVFLLILCFKQCSYGGINSHKNIINDDKINQQESNTSSDGIVYNGFPSSFTINKDAKYLSIENSMDNANKYYTGARIYEGDTMIYDMGEDVISPGKFANINLYDILSVGEHELTIVQYGCGMDKDFTEVATGTSQVVTVKVEK